MDAVILMLVYLLSQNPQFKNNLAPLTAKLKEGENALNFLNALSSFPCSPDRAAKNVGENAQNGCNAPQGGQGLGDFRSADFHIEQESDFSATSAAAAAPQEHTDFYNGSSDNAPLRSATSPLGKIGGEWLEKYLTSYLRK